LLDGREFADAEAERFRAECQAAEAETVRRLSAVLADTAEQALTSRVRALDRRTAVLVGLAVAGTLILGISGGWWAGERFARAEIAATEDSIRAAFREGPSAAALWGVGTQNGPRYTLRFCRAFDGAHLAKRSERGGWRIGIGPEVIAGEIDMLPTER
jgi:hypothetical protein